MRRTNLFQLAALTVLASYGSSATAQAETQFAVGGSLGTPGGTLEVQASFNDVFGVRGGYNYLTFGVDEDYDDLAYAGDLDMQTFGAFVDIHPFRNSFLLTGGAYLGAKELTGTAIPLQDVEVGDVVFTPTQVGQLDMTADIGDTAPFAGFGFDSTFQGDGPWGFKLIIGAMFTQSPSVTLRSVGGDRTVEGATDAQNAELEAMFQAELLKEARAIEQDAEDFKVFPVLQAGITFAF